MARREGAEIITGIEDYFTDQPPDKNKQFLIIREELLEDFPDKTVLEITEEVERISGKIKIDESNPNTFTFHGEETIVIDPDTWHSNWREDQLCLQQRAVLQLLELELGFDPNEVFTTTQDNPLTSPGFILRPNTVYEFLPI